MTKEEKQRLRKEKKQQKKQKDKKGENDEKAPSERDKEKPVTPSSTLLSMKPPTQKGKNYKEGAMLNCSIVYFQIAEQYYVLINMAIVWLG